MSDVIDLKARRMEKAQSLKEEFLIDNDHNEVARSLVPLIDTLEKLYYAFHFHMKENETTDQATEFLNQAMALFDSTMDVMIQNVEDHDCEPFQFFDEMRMEDGEANMEELYSFDHGQPILDRFILETRREDGSFNLERAIAFNIELREYNVLVASQLSTLIEELGPLDPRVNFKPIT